MKKDITIRCQRVEEVEPWDSTHVDVTLLNVDDDEVFEALEMDPSDVLEGLDLIDIYDWLDLNDVKAHFDLTEA